MDRVAELVLVYLSKSMAFTSGLVHNVFFVRWDRVSPGDAKKVIEQVAIARARVDGDMVYVAITPADHEPPAEAERRELADALPKLLSYCSCVHLVMEGSGFKHAIVRMVAAGVFLVSGKRGQVSLHDSAADALASCNHLARPASQILAAAREMKLIA